MWPNGLSEPQANTSQTSVYPAHSLDRRPPSVGGELPGGGLDVVGLGEDRILEGGLIGDEGVRGTDAANGRVEIPEALLCGPCGHLPPETTRQHILMHHH